MTTIHGGDKGWSLQDTWERPWERDAGLAGCLAVQDRVDLGRPTLEGDCYDAALYAWEMARVKFAPPAAPRPRPTGIVHTIESFLSTWQDRREWNRRKAHLLRLGRELSGGK